MTIAQLTAPSGEPVTLADVKAHLRLDAGDEDALLTALIQVAREHVERETGLVLLSRTFRLYLDCWPAGRVVNIARGPVTSIDQVTVYDAAGLAEDVALGGHVLDGAARPARLMLAETIDPGRPINGIEIDFTAGFGEAATDVPDGLKRAMLMHAAFMFAHRGVVDPEMQPAGVPAGYARLIAPFCRRGL